MKKNNPSITKQHFFFAQIFPDRIQIQLYNLRNPWGHKTTINFRKSMDIQHHIVLPQVYGHAMPHSAITNLWTHNAAFSHHKSTDIQRHIQPKLVGGNLDRGTSIELSKKNPETN